MTEEQEKQLALMRSISDHQEDRENFKRHPFTYPGCKYRSLEHVLPLLPYSNTFVECFGGSGVITLNRRPCNLDVYNDSYSGVVNFFRTVRNPELLQKLVNRIQLTPYSREEFKWSHDTWGSEADWVESAARWYCSIEMSFGGLNRNFGRAVSGKGTLWRHIQEKLPRFHDVAERFLKVQIENLDWRQCLEDYDSLSTVFYLDPPYPMHNVYPDTMSKADHIELCNRVFSLKGFVALSSYENSLYNSFPWDSVHEWTVQDTLTTMAKQSKTGGVYGLENIERGIQTEFLYIKEAEE